MKIAYFWTWEFSRNILSWLYKMKDIEIKLLVSQPNKIQWRKQVIKNTNIAEFALEKKLPILQPETLKNNSDFLTKLKSFDLDFIVVVAYWKIIPLEILQIPKYKSINLHWSILPKYRWASPVQESIKNGDTTTWLTTMFMSEWMDEWDILETKSINIWENNTSADIFKKFETFWSILLYSTLNWIINWILKPIAQNNKKASYCSKISKTDWEIFFQKENINQIYNKYRAYYTWPQIYSFYNWKKIIFEKVELKNDIDNLKLDKKNIWKVFKLDKKNIWIQCVWNNILFLKQVKLEWKKSMDILSFVNWNNNFLKHNF
jgi:methionyl-tRNA formyltransferase